jgi:hypothetical protein
LGFAEDAAPAAELEVDGDVVVAETVRACSAFAVPDTRIVKIATDETLIAKRIIEESCFHEAIPRITEVGLACNTPSLISNPRNRVAEV